MKTYCLIILFFNVARLTNAEETWTEKDSQISKSSSDSKRQSDGIAFKFRRTGIDFDSDRSKIVRPRSVNDLPKIDIDSRKINETGEISKMESELNNQVSEDERQSAKSSPQEDNNNFYPSRRVATKKKTPAKSTTTSKLGISEVTPKPTKYHYYPHNQHIYLLPECAVQQVCNAVYVRLNYTQPLCACPSRKEPCSASLNSDDQHTTELVTAASKKVFTLVKTCEPVTEMRMCRAPRDWSLLALQNIRTGKSHYLVICRCPNKGRLEGPMSHDQPAYASVPGIRVYGMMCIRDSHRIKRSFRYRRSIKDQMRQIPWKKVEEFNSSIQW